MILVFGKTGQVAKELILQAKDAVFLDRQEADLADPKACAKHIATYKPSCVINAAAYTAVDNAEDEADLAHIINCDAPTEMAQAAQKLAIPFLHISTDYVFSGNGETPYRPADAVAPLGVYGASKLAGEIGIRNAHDRAIILRTSWVFSAHGNNFVKSMLKYGTQNPEMKIVADQIGGPTPAGDIAAALLAMAQTDTLAEGGTFHFSGAPDVSWADFAREIFTQNNMSTRVIDIPTSEYKTKAKRPLNSRLNCDSLKEAYGIERPDWRTGLAKVLAELSS